MKKFNKRDSEGIYRCARLQCHYYLKKVETVEKNSLPAKEDIKKEKWESASM